jgi:hypothetical protein
VTIESIISVLALLVAVVGWIVNYKDQKRLAERQAELDKRTAEFQAELDQKRDMLATVQTALSSSYSASHAKIIEAHEVAWNHVLEVRKFSSKFLLFYSILYPHEYDDITSKKAKNHEKARQIVPQMNQKEFTETLPNAKAEVEPYRIFLGDVHALSRTWWHENRHERTPRQL